MVSRDFDVIVVGAGGAGLSAAVSAAQEGARVLVVDAASVVGGSTALSGGNFLAAGTHVQAAAGISDSADALYQYLAAINRYQQRPGVVRRYCTEAPPTLRWLEALGASFPVDELRVTGAFGPARAHRAAGHGAGLVAVLEQAALSAGVEIVLHTRISGLAFDDSGVVAGIRVDGYEVTAPAVVIATGGFGANPDLLQTHYPTVAGHGDWVWYIGTPKARGDALELIVPVRPDLWGHDEGLSLLTANFSRDVEVYLPGWLIFVNRDGGRFVDETTDYAIQAFAVESQTGKSCFAIFDSEGLAGSRAAVTDSRTAFASPNWKEDRLRELISQGKIIRAGHLAELAGRLGINAERLAGTIARYNHAVREGRDADFGKPAQWLRPLELEPYFGVELRPAIISITGYGPAIDEDARMLSRGMPIAGLFAAGEVTGGLGGALYAGNGASVGNAVVFGRIAGAGAAAFARMRSH